MESLKAPPRTELPLDPALRRELAETMAELTPVYAGGWLLPVGGFCWPFLLLPPHGETAGPVRQWAMLIGLVVFFAWWVVCWFRSGPPLERLRELRRVHRVDAPWAVKQVVGGGVFLVGHSLQELELVIGTNRMLTRAGVEVHFLGPTRRALELLRAEAKDA